MLSESYNKIISGESDGEYYLYFTDPHFVNTDVQASISDERLKRLEKLGEIFTESHAQFALCGGDWLNNSNSRESALEILAFIRNKVTSVFGEKSYLVLGNHDRNYQIKDSITRGIVLSDSRLTSEEIASAWFPEYGKTYYTFKTDASRFYVFDSGIDWWHEELKCEDEEQIEWFLASLRENDDKHIVIAPHMVHIAGTRLHPATVIYAEISNAYNSRRSYEYNGKIYEFSEKSGMVEYIIAGHDHKSQQGELSGIPYVIVPTMARGDSITSDLVFADYSARKLSIHRIGEGENREINLISLSQAN